MFQLDQYVDGLQRCPNEEALIAYFDDALKREGYTGYNIFYGYLDDRGQITPGLGGYDNSTLPASLTEAYDNEEWHAVDPLLSLGSRAPVPYSTASAFADAAPGSVKQTMWHAMLDYQIEHEINIPYRRNGSAGQVAIHMEGRRKSDFEHFQNTLPVAYAIASTFYNYFETNFLFQSPLNRLPVSPLTSREQDCLTWVAQGWSNNDIADKLTVSARTVKFHIENAMKKIDARTRSHAVAIALSRGFIQL